MKILFSFLFLTNYFYAFYIAIYAQLIILFYLYFTTHKSLIQEINEKK